MNDRTVDYKLNNTIFRVGYGNITQLRVDALVSSDDNYLSMGGGVSLSLLKAAGDVIRTEAQKHLPLKIGTVAVTSAGKLTAKYIFHAVTIDYTNMVYPSEAIIHDATLKCMELSDTLGIRTIALPALGTGTGGFPFQLGAEVMTHTIADYLMGETQLELVFITLFARENVRDSDLNLFYERAVSLASISTQSKRLHSLLSELERIIGKFENPALLKRVIDLQNDLSKAQGILREKTESIERLNLIQGESGIEGIAQQVISVSGDAQNITVWADKQLEAKVLKTKMTGLLTQLNIQNSHLNRFQIEKAKYGGQLVPPRLEIAIEDMNKEIAETDLRVSEVRKQLAAVVAGGKYDAYD